MDVEEIYAGRGEDRVKIGEVRKLKFWNKPQALEPLAKHIGMMKDHHVLEGPGGGAATVRFEWITRNPKNEE